VPGLVIDPKILGGKGGWPYPTASMYIIEVSKQKNFEANKYVQQRMKAEKFSPERPQIANMLFGTMYLAIYLGT